MRVLRRGAKLQLKIFFAALILAGVFWFSYGRSEPETWRLFSTGKLVKIEIENAIYEKTDSPDYFLRVKITNLSPRFVGLERYQNARPTPSRLGEPLAFSCELAEGNHPNTMNGEGLIFLIWDAKTMEKLALAKFRAGKLPRIAPGASQEFFLIDRNSKTGIAHTWQSAPLWWRSKRFLPNDNFRSPYVIALIKGQITATDGQNAQWFAFNGRSEYLAFKYPIHTKVLP